MSKWEEVGNGSWRGKVGGRILFAIVPRETDYAIWLFNDGDGVASDTLEGAKAKGEEMLQEWLKDAGLVAKPVKCDKCADSGIEQLGFEAYPCPCRKDPSSLWYFNNVIMREE